MVQIISEIFLIYFLAINDTRMYSIFPDVNDESERFDPIFYCFIYFHRKVLWRFNKVKVHFRVFLFTCDTNAGMISISIAE